MNVPIIRLNAFLQNLRTTGLLGNDCRYTALHRFQRRNTKWLGHRRHNVNIAGFQHFIYLPAFHKSGEMETIGNSAFSNQTNHLIHHIATTGHYKTYILGTLQHHSSRLYEILRSFLHSDTSQESNHFFFRILIRNNIQNILRQR